jgi:mxaJ protein
MRTRLGLAVLVIVLAGSAVPSSGTGTLRICADPNNLPFSNEARGGFENRIADVLAAELGTEVRYTWWAQRRGFVRNTLREGLCDVLMGVPAGFDPVLTTRPYYRSTYVFVTRTGGVDVRSLDDPALRTLRIGVQLIGNDYVNTPPVHALSQRGIVGNLVGYTVYGDYREPNPPARVVDAVARGEVDIAIVWGPLAGYFAPRQSVALRLSPVTPAVEPPAIRQVFAIAIGVRKGDTALRDALDAALDRRRADIDAILTAYGVPRVEAPSEARP